MYFCRNDTVLDIDVHKYEKHKFNYEKDKVKPRPKIILKYYNKTDIIASRKWYGLNINNITIKIEKIYHI
tara:strand:- start:275 stop:484 length:210 start_codon:yes stop_codon:yes gene_type:complete